ncbi:hypothetical protein HKX48_004247 [Thoreauomyces humboldtii]|nr:hypothetical protein HKX48_004247 [Thoreauomyces humboldtii]
MHVVVIGAGPSGLVTAKTLLESNINRSFLRSESDAFTVTVLEQERTLGGTFKFRAYENAELVSSKQLTAFSDFRFEQTSDHVSAPDYVAYLDAYAERNSLGKHIQFGATVTAIDRKGDGRPRHVIEYTTQDGQKHVLECDALAMCSGLHVTPNIIEVPGLTDVRKPIEVIHSSQYHSREQLKGRDVLILGCGETAMDIAYEARQENAGKRVVLSHRNGFLSFPKVLGGGRDNGIPLDTLISNCFENAYVHPLVRWSRFRWHFSDQFVRLALVALTGTSIGFSQWVAPPKHVGRAWNFLNKSTRAMPYINRPYKRSHHWKGIADFLEDGEHVEGEVIECYPWIDHLDASGQVHFKRNETESSRMEQKSAPFRPDLIVCATGYTQPPLFRTDPSTIHSDSPAPSRVREILTSSSDPTVAHIGLVRPNVGAIPPISEMQAMWWTCVLRGTLDPKRLQSSDGHYRLLPTTSRRIDYGVDHSAYVYQLATDMHAAPSVLQGDLLRSPRLLVAYCLCAAFNPLFRLVGPFRWKGAEEVVLGELWETVARRGVLGNAFMTVLPMVTYGVINGGLCVAELLVWFAVMVLDLFVFAGYRVGCGWDGMANVFSRGVYGQ